MRNIFFLFLEENIVDIILCIHNIFSQRIKENVNFQASKSWLDKWILLMILRFVVGGSSMIGTSVGLYQHSPDWQRKKEHDSLKTYRISRFMLVKHTENN